MIKQAFLLFEIIHVKPESIRNKYNVLHIFVDPSRADSHIFKVNVIRIMVMMIIDL